MIVFISTRKFYANISALTYLTVLTTLLIIHGMVSHAICQDDHHSQDLDPHYVESGTQEGGHKGISGRDIWRAVWGKKARDAILFGMWSLHLDGTGEYFGDGRNNDQGNLIGMQYYGITAGTLINSFDDRTWFIGAAREVYSRSFTENSRLDIGYRLGLLYGYDDKLINVGGITAYAAGVFGFSWKRIGVDIALIPVGIITCNFRIDIDNLFSGGD
jgi:hypothetical protein